MNKFFDVAIIGSSIAGSCLAHCLSKYPINICLIDKDAFPRKKVCGEGLSKLGAEQLKKIGLEDALLSSNPMPFHGYTIWRAKRSPVNISNQCFTLGYGIKRESLDFNILTSALKNHNVSFFSKTKITAISVEKDFITLTINGSDRIQAKIVILANGANSQLLNEFGKLALIETHLLNNTNYRTGANIYLSGEYKGDKVVNVFLKEGGEICATRVSKNALNISLLGDKNFIQSFSSKIENNNEISEICKKVGFKADLISSLSGGGMIHSKLRKSLSPRIYLIGDACEQFDPLGGMGMTHAVASARLASIEILKHFRGEACLERALNNYTAKRASMARKLRGLTRLTHFTLNNNLLPVVQDTILKSQMSASLVYGIELNSGLQSPSNLIATLFGIEL